MRPHPLVLLLSLQGAAAALRQAPRVRPRRSSLATAVHDPRDDHTLKEHDPRDDHTLKEHIASRRDLVFAALAAAGPVTAIGGYGLLGSGEARNAAVRAAEKEFRHCAAAAKEEGGRALRASREADAARRLAETARLTAEDAATLAAEEGSEPAKRLADAARLAAEESAKLAAEAERLAAGAAARRESAEQRLAAAKEALRERKARAKEKGSERATLCKRSPPLPPLPPPLAAGPLSPASHSRPACS